LRGAIPCWTCSSRRFWRRRHLPAAWSPRTPETAWSMLRRQNCRHTKMSECKRLQWESSRAFVLSCRERRRTYQCSATLPLVSNTRSERSRSGRPPPATQTHLVRHQLQNSSSRIRWRAFQSHRSPGTGQWSAQTEKPRRVTSRASQPSSPLGLSRTAVTNRHTGDRITAVSLHARALWLGLWVRIRYCGVSACCAFTTGVVDHLQWRDAGFRAMSTLQRVMQNS